MVWAGLSANSVRYRVEYKYDTKINFSAEASLFLLRRRVSEMRLLLRLRAPRWITPKYASPYRRVVLQFILSYLSLGNLSTAVHPVVVQQYREPFIWVAATRRMTIRGTNPSESNYRCRFDLQVWMGNMYQLCIRSSVGISIFSLVASGTGRMVTVRNIDVLLSAHCDLVYGPQDAGRWNAVCTPRILSNVYNCSCFRDTADLSLFSNAEKIWWIFGTQSIHANDPTFQCSNRVWSETRNDPG